MVGVCVSGAMRSMASRAVQQTFLRAMDALGDEACQVEIMAHVSVTNLPSIGFEPTPQQVESILSPLRFPREEVQTESASAFPCAGPGDAASLECQWKGGGRLVL